MKNSWTGDRSNIACRRRYFATLIMAYSVEWFALAIAPFNRQDWLLENALVLVLFCCMAFLRHNPLSNMSNTLIFIFLSFHGIGAHYTYSLVPYVEWGNKSVGVDINALFGWQRNHFDRLVHFLYGVLFFYPLREVCLRFLNVRGATASLLSLALLVSGSVAYELIEWAAALIFGGDLGEAYVGAQGDAWDAQGDMALAAGGALLSVFIFRFMAGGHASQNPRSSY